MIKIKIILITFILICILFTGCFNPADKLEINITSPQNGATVSDTVTIKAEVTVDLTITKVEIYVDDILRGVDDSAPYTIEWNTKTASNGNHKLKAVAYDSKGICCEDDDTEVTVYNEITEAPSGSSNWGEMVWGLDNWG